MDFVNCVTTTHIFKKAFNLKKPQEGATVPPFWVVFLLTPSDQQNKHSTLKATPRV